jgi:23S rRNA pseudouridine1911/1915/1917 synthase
VHEIEVGRDASGLRVDQHLAACLPLSRSRIQGLADDGHVRVDGQTVKAAEKLKVGQRIVVDVPAPVPTTLIAEDIALSILFEDDDLIVIDKPAGLAVHPGAGIASGTVANAVLFHAKRLAISGEVRPGIVHRLDKDTSGVLVVAKNDDTLQGLQRAFAAREVNKRYLAWCLGAPAHELELITGHRRADGDRRRFTTKVQPEGNARLAHTRARVLVSAGGISELEVELLTGRTHQIRAHLADIGHPLLQDDLYGGGQAQKRLKAGPVRDAVVQLSRQALHARTLAFTHPRTKKAMTFEAPLPADLARVHAAVTEGA